MDRAAPNIQQLAEDGWIHLDNLNRVALCPFAQMHEYQQQAERLAALSEVKERICIGIRPADFGTALFNDLMEIITEQQQEVEWLMEQAAQGYISQTMQQAPPLIEVEQKIIRRRIKKDKPQ